jgi:uncharacterized phiE125 gp8 family phage protein
VARAVPLLAGIAIDLRAGYGESAGDVPALLVQAVRLLVARSFEHRGNGEEPPPPPELRAPRAVPPDSIVARTASAPSPREPE